MGKKTITKRKPINKKLRFDVFKRDGFQCVYCGRTPPSVVVEALNIAISRFGDDRGRVLSYFCGVCWRKIKKDGYDE